MLIQILHKTRATKFKAMKKLTILFVLIISFHCVRGQEQFSKRFDVQLDKVPLARAVQELNQTQHDQSLIGLGSSELITLKLKNVTFDQAMDSLLMQQKSFKGYQVIDYFTHKNLLLTKSASSNRYFDREKRNIKKYHIGEKLPDTVFNGNSSSDDLFTKKRKPLTILMLWNVNCTACIMEMPYLERLQNRLAKDLRISMAMKDSKEALSELIKHAKNVQQLKLPNITGENILPSSFDYLQVPTQVWLDSTNTIVYITKADIANEHYIKEFLRGERLNIPELKDTLLSSGNHTLPIALMLSPLQQGKFAISSYLAPHLQSKYWYGMAGQIFDDTVSSIRRVRYTVSDMYRFAYLGTDEKKYNGARVIYSIPLASKLAPDPVTWKNYYDYELTIKRKISKSEFFKIMQNDLDNGLDLSSHIEKKTIPCYILTSIAGKKLPDLKIVPEEPQLADHKLDAVNVTLADALRLINRMRLDKPTPVLNETGLKEDAVINIGSIDLDFENHVDPVKAAFEKAGIKLTIQNRSIDCIIINSKTSAK